MCWDAGSRPPIADVLSVLANLMPPTLEDAALVQQPDFSHTDRYQSGCSLYCTGMITVVTVVYHSLGMVFLSVSDSTDVGVEVQSASSSVDNSIGHSASGSMDRGAGWDERTVVTDKELAEQLQLEARQYLLAQDAHLAEQLQLRENSYRVPR